MEKSQRYVYRKLDPFVGFSSPSHASASWEFGYTAFYETLDSNGATIVGLTVTWEVM